MSWSVIVCEPLKEGKLAEAIGEAGLEAFSPTFTAWRLKFGKHRSIVRALAPGYVFAILDHDDIHTFKSAGARRILPMNWRDSLRLAAFVQEWRELTEAGAFDEPRPDDPKPWKLPKPRRNRKARRQSGVAKRKAVEFRDGLQEILTEMTTGHLEAEAA